MKYYLVPDIPEAVPYSVLVRFIGRYYPFQRYYRYISQYLSEEDMREATTTDLYNMYHEYICEDLLMDPETLLRETGITYVGDVE